MGGDYLKDSKEDRYMIIITDGIPNCHEKIKMIESDGTVIYADPYHGKINPYSGLAPMGDRVHYWLTGTEYNPRRA